MMGSHILEIQNLWLSYGSTCVGADINLSLNKSDALGIVGESGCGKSTLLKAIIDPAEYGVSFSGGTIKYKGEDMAKFSSTQLRKMKGVEIAMILQNPFAAFNPIRLYRKQFYETLKSHNRWRGTESIKEILEVFQSLGLPGGERILSSYPFEMSGGMNQRISIALSMLLRPALLLADEPTSALDVTLQSQVIRQLRQMREITDVTMILVSHNLSVIVELCNKTAVMYGGYILEYGDTKDVLLHPQHPYTKSLLKAIPTLRGPLPEGIDGMPPLCVSTSHHCCFSERCTFATPECQYKPFKMEEVSPNHYSSCTKTEIVLERDLA